MFIDLSVGTGVGVGENRVAEAVVVNWVVIWLTAVIVAFGAALGTDVFALFVGLAVTVAVWVEDLPGRVAKTVGAMGEVGVLFPFVGVSVLVGGMVGIVWCCISAQAACLPIENQSISPKIIIAISLPGM